jgi:DNA repair protein RadD
MYLLRPYQQDAVDSGIGYFESYSKERPMLVLPTAAGKSIIIARIVKALSGEVLILQPSQELLKQNYQKYDHVIKDNPDLERASIYSASVGIKEQGRVTFAMIGSVVNKAEMFQNVRYVLIDECHRVPPKKDSMYMQFLKKLPNVQVIGLTATPYRLKSYTDLAGNKFSKINLLNRELPRFFNRFLHITQIKEMYEQGYLCPINYIEMQWDGSFLEFNSTGAEYSDDSMKKAIERNNIIGRIPNVVEQAIRKGQKSCLVFVRTVEEARSLSAITPFSSYVHALTPKKERVEIIKSFKNGSIKTLYNVAVLTEGFDYPELDTVIIARPTMSLALFVQMIGRGIRLADGKEKCAVVDMCGNLKKFGRIEELRIENDEIEGWVLRNDKQILSGRRLDELV